jgi:hypothetical protein
MTDFMRILHIVFASAYPITSTSSLDFKASSAARATVLTGPAEPSTHNDLEKTRTSSCSRSFGHKQ